MTTPHDAEDLQVRDFYDDLAGDYHLVYDDWLAAIERQATALDHLIRTLHTNPMDVLDCSCGIGTQAIGLARLGYRVCGTDISEVSLQRARSEAALRGVDASFARCDFRDLSQVPGTFDAVISMDNALPHMLTDADLAMALRAMCSKVRARGVLVISVRDYDRAMIDRPATALPLVHRGPPRQVVVRLHDWDAPESPMHTVHFLVLTEGRSEWTVSHHSTRYRAVGRRAISTAAQHAGFTQVTWHAGDDAGFHQPVMTSRVDG